MWHPFPAARRALAMRCRSAVPALLCSYGSCSKSFGESTPSREACRAHSSPNSPISPRLVKPPPLEGPRRHIAHQTIWNKAVPNPLWHFPDPVSLLPFPVSPLPVFPTCNVRKKNAILHNFSSGRVTSGNCQCAFQAPLWHILVFRTCNVRKKNAIPRTFSS